MTTKTTSRRAFLASAAAVGALGLSGRLPGGAAAADDRAAATALLTRPIPKTGEALPVIGMGSWITFNVGDDAGLRAQRVRVLERFFERGGGLVDSSPMYGSSEAVIGHCLANIERTDGLFSATKVWTWTKWMGVRQMEESERLWGVRHFDLMQIHNLLDWEAHLETLTAWKADRRVRYIGITSSHGRRHDELADVMAEKPIDFVQFTYNVVDREAERRLLPLAADRGLAVTINRPFRRGALIDRLERHPLPGWAAEIGCANWAQVLLKFIVSHPAVTCAIPATSRVDHMEENMGAARGPLPDAALRRRMIRDVEAL